MVGYHYYIKKDGTVQDGRPLEMVGAHCEGWNLNSIGICLGGREKFTEFQFTALKDLVDKLRITYTIPLSGILPHNELDKHGKTCPNFNIDFLKGK